MFHLPIRRIFLPALLLALPLFLAVVFIASHDQLDLLGVALTTGGALLLNILLLTQYTRNTDRLRQQIVDSFGDALFLLDQDQRIVVHNKAASGFGQKLLGQKLTDVLHFTGLARALAQAMEQKTIVAFDHMEATTTVRYYRIHIAAHTAARALGIFTIITISDTTELRRAEKARVDFVANASHELRTPISTILGFLETLRGSAKDDIAAQTHFLNIIDQQARRMSRLINDLLSLSRIELLEDSPPHGKVSIPDVLETVVVGLQLEAQKKAVMFHLRIDENLPQANGVADEISQVLQNLIDNAIKYTRPNTKITIVAQHVLKVQDPEWFYGDAISIAIIDEGEGIAAEHLPRLTERFYRVDTARSRAVGGTGLGLAIVKHVLNRHRGRLMIESTVGVGTCFTVLFPLSLEPVHE